jgi:parallel beta-helix repeat protein
MNGLRYGLRLVLCSAVVLVLAPLQVAGGATASTTFVAVADSYVDAGSPSSNFGTAATIRADASPQRTAYLRFNVQGGGGAQPVTLKLYAHSSNSTGVQIRGVASTTWGETTITHANAPPVGAVVDSSSVQAGHWHHFDVSSLVTGDGLVSFAVTTTSGTAITLSSRQGSNAPQLVVGPVPNSSPYLVTRSGSTYQAQSQTTGTTFTGTLKSVVESAVGDLNQTGGGTVNFSAGTFDLGSDYFKPENISDITFAGAGMNQTVIQNSSSAAGDTEPFNFSGTTRVTVRDLTVSAGGPFRSTSDALDFDFGNDSTVERVKVTASRGRGIVFDGKDSGWFSANNVIRNCVIDGVPSDGIELLASDNNLVEGCTITNSAGHGIQMAKASNSGAQPNKTSNDNVIRNNVVDNSGQDGININGGHRNRLEGNQVTNSSNINGNRDGIRIGTTDGIACNDTVVQNNTATDNQATKTQRYGLAITSGLCNRTVVGPNNFTGNRVGPILDQGTNTQYTGADTQPPTTPTGVAASAISHSLVRVTWNASNDNVGVAGYRIYRNGSGTPMATVGGSTLSFDDTTVLPSTTYTYRVDAVDAVPLASPQSSPPASATTPAGPPDTQPPTTPSNVTASAISHALVRVTWTASIDNVGVVSYRIYRNGVATPYATVGGSTLTFDDTNVAPNTTYTYTVDAVDAVPLASAKSSPPASATTPAAPSAFTFNPVADSYVNEPSPTTNYGTSAQLRIDGSPVLRAYLRFTVSGVVGNIASAKLRIYANSASSTGHEVHGVTDNTWGETTINFSNAPGFGGTVVASGAFPAGGYVEVDVTSLITGNGTYSLALIGPGSTAVSLASRESATPPELVVNVG